METALGVAPARTSLVYPTAGYSLPDSIIAIPVFWGPRLPSLDALGELLGFSSADSAPAVEKTPGGGSVEEVDTLVIPVGGSAYMSSYAGATSIFQPKGGLLPQALSLPGQVPEPMTLSLLALGAMGAAGLGFARRRRRAAS